MQALPGNDFCFEVDPVISSTGAPVIASFPKSISAHEAGGQFCNAW